MGDLPGQEFGRCLPHRPVDVPDDRSIGGLACCAARSTMMLESARMRVVGPTASIALIAFLRKWIEASDGSVRRG